MGAQSGAAFFDPDEAFEQPSRLAGRKSKSVKRMNDHRYAGDIGGQSPENSRFRGMRMNNVGSYFSEQLVKGEECQNIFEWVYGADEPLHKMRLPCSGFCFFIQNPPRAADQYRFKLRRIKVSNRIQRIALSAPQLQLGNDVRDSQFALAFTHRR